VLKETSVPKTYWITFYRTISDPGKLAEYGRLAGPAITSGGGTFLVRNQPTFTYEDGQPERTVIIEFESLEAARTTHDGSAYQAALRALGDGAVRDVRIVEGV
jgi:uncharacterized protein (DUF1330 family)